MEHNLSPRVKPATTKGKKSTRVHKIEMSDCTFGSVGYTFRKYFPGYGYFTGMVVQIRPAAAQGKDRRCVYSDGDQEDLSLSELRSLAQVEKLQTQPVSSLDSPFDCKQIEDYQQKTFSSIEQNMKKLQTSSGVTTFNVQSGLAEKQAADTKQWSNQHRAQESAIGEFFKAMNDIVPIDKAAEATLHQQCAKKRKQDLTGRTPQLESNDTGDGSDNDDQHQEAWLEAMASKLGAGDRSRSVRARQKKTDAEDNILSTIISVDEQQKQKTSEHLLPSVVRCDTESRCSSLSSEKGGKVVTSTLQGFLTQISNSSDFVESKLRMPNGLEPTFASPISSISIGTLVCLADIEPGHRHGIKVFNPTDEKRIVGEVILEHKGGWAEAIINGAVIKSRVGHLVVAPEQYNIGESVNSNLPLPSRLMKIIKSAINITSNRSKLFSDQSAALSSSTTKDTAIDRGLERRIVLNNENDEQTDFVSAARAALQEPPDGPSFDPMSSRDSLFYWCCEACTMTNPYYSSKCDACDRKRGKTCKLSALLEMADTAVAAATTIDDAVEFIPPIHRPVIPRGIIAVLMQSKKPNTMFHSNSTRSSLTNLDAYFYWSCGFCTMTNSYKKFSCEACLQKKTKLCTDSVLLSIAAEAAKNANTVEEALRFVPLHHQPAIPKSVLNCLVTCVAMIGKKHDQRRCRRAKSPGMDYCALHCDPMFLTSSRCKESNEYDQMREDASGNFTTSKLPLDNCSTSRFNRSDKTSLKQVKTILSIQKDVSNFFKKAHICHANRLRWHIHCVEDAILCQETTPFPLGLLVRRFFPQYGFHDGRVILVKRQSVRDPEHGSDRPVLVYRIQYNDGDEEDMMHHEIQSLRQIYDRCNVAATSPPFLQLVSGTMYETQGHGIAKIVKSTTPSTATNKCEGGIVHVKYCSAGQPWKDLQLDLTQLQLVVLRKLNNETVMLGPAGSSCFVDEEEESLCFDSSLCGFTSKAIPRTATLSPTKTFALNAPKPQPSPVLEWPALGRPSHCFRKNVDSQTTSLLKIATDFSNVADVHDDEVEWTVSPGLKIHRNMIVGTYGDGDYQDLLFENESKNGCCILNDASCMRPGLVRPPLGWDPAGGCSCIEWDPFDGVVCELCGDDKDDHQILICDECHRGYHTYCVRPVIVNVPTSEWLCYRCTPSNVGKQTFDCFLKELQNDPKRMTQFISMPFDSPEEFCSAHKESLEMFAPKTHASKRIAAIGAGRSRPTVKVGSLFFSRTVNKNDWVIPVPLSIPHMFSHSIATMVAAMQYCGMSSHSEELVYPLENGVCEDMNNASLDTVEPLSQRNLDIFLEYKSNLRLGADPPIRIVHDDEVGFIVEALAIIPRHTLITEYVGEITTIDRSGETSSDSLMMLLDSGDPKTSLIIDPTRTGNIARFLSGINNRSHASRRKANVRTRRFVLDGKCRVALFTAKRVEPGDKLHYDYNAGVEGKTVIEWAKNGFYDTSNFF